MRQSTETLQGFRFGVFEVDLRTGELYKQGQKVKLQEQPFQVLVLLLERAGDVVTREEIQKQLWPVETFVDSDHGLNIAINKIREGLGDSADNPRFVETLPKRGYRFIAPVQELNSQKPETMTSAVTSEESSKTEPARPRRATWRYAAASLGALIAGVVIWNLRTPESRPIVRFAITLPPNQAFTNLGLALAISPDGKNLVYVAVQGGTHQLFLRPLDGLEAKPIAGTEGAVSPFFSPDSQWIGFFAGGKLKKISVNGGAAVTLFSSSSMNRPGGASWSSLGTLALQPFTMSQGLQQVSQDGGTPQPLTRIEKGEFIHRWPEFLPAGKAVLFAGSASLVDWGSAQIAVQPAGTGERKNLVQGGSQPRYAVTGHLLYAQSGTLMAAPFDMKRLALAGAAVPALEGVMQSNFTGAAQYGISSTGTLVYLPRGLPGNQSRMVWVSRHGEEQPLPAAPHNYQFPRVSPDGRRVAVNIADQDLQIWVYDVSRDTLTRLTFEGNINRMPAWSPDGKRIAYISNRAGPQNLFWEATDGSGRAERLTTSNYIHLPNSFSPDGQLLSFVEITPQTGRDIWVLNLKDRKPQRFLGMPYEEAMPKFSPDGKWLAYSSDESGHREIYVQPYPGPGGKWQVSSDGGQEPVWNPRGEELFYRSASKIMAVDINTKSGFSSGKPRMLFDGPYLSTDAGSAYYDVSPDAQHFLMLKLTELQTSAPTQINVVLNWFTELQRRIPVK